MTRVCAVCGYSKLMHQIVKEGREDLGVVEGCVCAKFTPVRKRSWWRRLRGLS